MFCLDQKKGINKMILTIRLEHEFDGVLLSKQERFVPAEFDSIPLKFIIKDMQEEIIQKAKEEGLFKQELYIGGRKNDL